MRDCAGAGAQLLSRRSMERQCSPRRNYVVGDADGRMPQMSAAPPVPIGEKSFRNNDQTKAGGGSIWC
jgi:hypothetical protein